MRMGKRILIMVLAMCLLLCACGANGAEEETTAPTEATAVPTEAPAITEPAQEELGSEAILPTKDVATGTLKFYIKDKAIYAGGPVSDLLDAGVQTYEDVSTEIQPWHISGNTRFRIELEDTAEGDRPYIFVTVINASEDPRPFSECLIYSVTVNCNGGIGFGSGNETEPFVTMETTLEQILAAYGEPGYRNSAKTGYEEIAYYEPFSCAYFSFKGGVVRQVMTNYCANIYGELAENQDFKLEGYFGNDAYILMNQYMDVKPYMEQDGTEETKTYAPDLDEFIVLAGGKIELGKKVEDMPEEFSGPFENLTQYISRNYYIRTGKDNEEEFYLMNTGEMGSGAVKYATVKGVITQNLYYTNWGFDYSGFHEFEYQGLKSDSTIEDVLELFGLPQELEATSSAKACYVWMHYEDESGNTLRVCVDPMVDQVIELRVAKYIEGEQHY